MDTPLGSSIGPKRTWLDFSIFRSPVFSLEKLIFAAIMVLTIFTRLYMLEPRVMSHDETSHTYFSWLYYKGDGYAHDPVTHGPFQFHVVALSYFLFGDSDTTARIPAALFSIATVAFMWAYRRYLGRAGALVAALLLAISPYMLYYGRYVRNEAFVAFFGVVMLWSILRYLDTAKYKYLYIFTAVTVLHFATKETSFIYTAQALLFLAFYLLYRMMRRKWNRPEYRSTFIITLILSLAVVFAGLVLRSFTGKMTATQVPQYPALASLPPFLSIALMVLGVLGLIAAIYFAISGFGLSRIREERVFDLLILLGTLVLPQLSAFGINALGWKIPVNAAEVQALTLPDMLHMAIILVPIIIASIIIGIWWNRRQWLINAAIWYVIFIVLYTSVFTNGAGLFTGMVGSLGYWLAQQGVNRGDQPFYYYALIQIPIYEFLPAIGSILGIILYALGRKTIQDDTFVPENPQLEDVETNTDIIPDSETSPEMMADEPVQPEPVAAVVVQPPTVSLLIFWAITSLLAYSVAGEKMPWLTVHITLPMILLSGWAIGYLIDTTDWEGFKLKKGWLVVSLLFVFIPAVVSTIRIWLGTNPPFAGKSLDQLSATSGFVISLVMAVASAIGLFFLLRDWSPRMIRRSFGLVFFSLLAFLTARACLYGFLHQL